MVKLEDFLREELNADTAGVILRTVTDGRGSGKTEGQLIFNRFSLDFFFGDNRILIYDDIFSEEEPLHLDLDESLKSIP